MWSRVSKEAAEKGFCFETLGRALMAIFKSEVSKIQAMEIIFVTSSREDLKPLESIDEQVRQISQSITKDVWKAKGYDLDEIECTLGWDCRSCEYKPVCDEIRTVVKVRKKKTSKSKSVGLRTALVVEPFTSGERLVAMVGKGGTGKTAFTAMMTKVLLESGRGGKLLLIDADPAMGLPLALGVNVERTVGQAREKIIQTARKGKEEEKQRLANTVDYLVMEALNEMNGFAMLAMGRTDTLGCYCPVNDILRSVIETLADSFDTILIDGEAGLEQINRQVMGYVDTLTIVSDATSRGLQTAAQIKEMAQSERVIKCDKLGIVFNRVHGSEELLKQSAQDMGLEVFGYIPQDEDIAHYDLLGKPLMELTTSPGLAAVRTIVEKGIFAERFS